MKLVLLTALGIGGSTVIGAVIGFFVKRVSHKMNDAILSFAAGIMLAAAIQGLIVPAFEMAGKRGLYMPLAGIFMGALFLNFMDRALPHLHRLSGSDPEVHANNKNLDRALLFVLAMALHNLPEGMAAGVGFGNEDVSMAFTVAAGIALQNIPEGVVTVAPLVMAGVGRGRAFLLAAATGCIEVLGVFLGYAMAGVSRAILPLALAFAGGTMLYIVSDEMIPETHSHGHERLSTYSLLAGFSLMMVMDMLL